MFSRILAFRTLLLFLAGAFALAAPVWAQEAALPVPGSSSVGTLSAVFTPDAQARPAAGFPLHLTFALNSAKEAGLPALLAAQQDKKSPSYHKWLTPAQFGQQFGATNTDIQAVEDFAHSKGFITRLDSNHLFVQAETTVAGAENAFGITLKGFNRPADRIKLGESPTFYAPDQAPRVPASLLPRLKGIFGLTDFVQMHFHASQMKKAARPSIAAAAPLIPVKSVTTTSSFSSPLSPQQLSTVYEIDAIHNLGYHGAGTSIGIYSPTQYATSDINSFASNYGLSGYTVNQVNIDGGPTNLNGQVEACLDIETIIGQAPNTNVYVYQGPNNGSLDFWSRIAGDNVPVISNSWSFTEYYLHNNGFDSYVNSVATYLSQMQSQGQAHYVATGDNGAFDGNGNSLVDFPSSYPGSTAVGGTDQLTDDGSNNWASEVGWSGSGGGLSLYYGLPSWQTGPGVSNGYSNGMRQVPDVSALGGPNPGYSIATKGGFYQVWGTSASTPLWASVHVLLNQAVNGRFGSLNSYLYYLGTDVNDFKDAEIYHDMTSGNNDYPATSGWDFVTGWGSARFNKLYYQLFDLPVLTPYSLSGWTSPINIAGPSGEPAYFDNQTTYTINAAYANSGLADAPREYFKVNLDGTDHTQYSISDPSGYYVVYTNLFSTPLSLGQHTFTLTLNSQNTIGLGSGSVTTYTRTINVASNTTTYVYDIGATIGSNTDLYAYVYRNTDSAAVTGRTVTFQVDGSTVGTAVTDSSGYAILGYSLPASLTRGTHTITGSLSADSGYNPSSGTGTLYAYANTTLKGANASGGIGQMVNLSATLTVTAGGAKVAGETVTFSVDGTSVGTGVTNSAGTATFAYTIPSGTTSGSHPLAFSYDGSGTTYYNASSGSGTLTVAKLNTAVTVGARTGAHGTTVVLKSYLKTSGGVVLPGRTLSYKVNGVAAGSAVTDSTGLASLNYAIPASAPAGNEPIAVSFAGDSGDNPSSGAGTLTVTAPVLSTAITVPDVAGTQGQTVTLSATLKAGSTLLNGKTLTFKVDSATVGTAVTNASGVATKTFAIPAAYSVGSHTISVTFAGDSGDSASSGTGTLTVSAGTTKLNTVVTVGARVGQAGTTAVLKSYLKTSGGAVLAGKTLSYKVNGVAAGSAVTDSTGLASLNYAIPASAPAGDEPIAVSFAGDSGDNPSSGSNVLTVTAGTTKLNTVVTVGNRVAPHGTTTVLKSYLKTSGGAVLAGKTLSYKVNGVAAGSAVTDSTGLASLNYAIPASAPAGNEPIAVSFAGDSGDNPSSGAGTLTVTN